MDFNANGLDSHLKGLGSPRRVKVTQACDRCKNRKQRCDGGTPCKRCIKQACVCVYTNIDKRGMKSSKGVTKNRSGLSQLPVNEPKVNIPPINLSSSNNSGDLSQNGQQNLPTYKPYNRWKEARLPQDLKPLLSFPVSSRNNNTNGIAQLYPEKVDIARSDTCTDVESQESRRPSIEISNENPKFSMLSDISGKFIQRKEGSSLSYFYQCRKILETVDFTAEAKDIAEVEILSVIDAPFKKSNYTNYSHMQLPSKAHTKYLVKIFKENINDSNYVFDMEVLNTAIDNIYDDPMNASKILLSLVYLTIAMGACYAKIAGKVYPLTKYQQIDPNILFSKGIDLLSVSEQESHLPIVQAYLLIFFYYLYFNKKNTAWINLGMAIRHAQTLAIHNQTANDSYDDPEYRLHRRKIWRTLYINDRLISLYLGRPLSIIDADWDDQDWLLQYNIVETPINDLCQRYTTKLLSLVGEILNEVIDKPKLDIKMATKYAEKMKRWSAQLPDNLRIQKSVNPNVVFGDPVNHPLILMHITHLRGISLLSTPFFLYFISREVKRYNTGRTDPLDFNSKNEPAIRNLFFSCLKTSMLKIKLVEYFFLYNVTLLKPQKMINSIYTGGLTLCLYLLVVAMGQDTYEGDTVSSCLELINTTLKVLSAYSHVDIYSHRFHQLIHQISRLIYVRLKQVRDDIHNEELERIYSYDGANDNVNQNNLPRPATTPAMATSTTTTILSNQAISNDVENNTKVIMPTENTPSFDVINQFENWLQYDPSRALTHEALSHTLPDLNLSENNGVAFANGGKPDDTFMLDNLFYDEGLISDSFF